MAYACLKHACALLSDTTVPPSHFDVHENLGKLLLYRSALNTLISAVVVAADSLCPSAVEKAIRFKQGKNLTIITCWKFKI